MNALLANYSCVAGIGFEHVALATAMDSRIRPRQTEARRQPQDHECARGQSRRRRSGLGFSGFRTARRTLAGFEAMAMIRKGQVRYIGGLRSNGQSVNLNLSEMQIRFPIRNTDFDVSSNQLTRRFTNKWRQRFRAGTKNETRLGLQYRIPVTLIS